MNAHTKTWSVRSGEYEMGTLGRSAHTITLPSRQTPLYATLFLSLDFLLASS